MRFVWIVIARLLFAAVFIVAGIKHFSGTLINDAAAAGAPAPSVLVPLAGVLAIVGGLSIAVGAFTRIGALVLVAYLVLQTVLTGPELVNFALLGGALAFFYFGSGPISVDDRLAATHRSWRRYIDLQRA
ncbi:MAG TPA: DoxX family protein [Kofleriaceae bacterium]|nr:DoxX family protein [Kofleriaceae bacterium]